MRGSSRPPIHRPASFGRSSTESRCLGVSLSALEVCIGCFLGRRVEEPSPLTHPQAAGERDGLPNGLRSFNVTSRAGPQLAEPAGWSTAPRLPPCAGANSARTLGLGRMCRRQFRPSDGPLRAISARWQSPLPGPVRGSATGPSRTFRSSRAVSPSAGAGLLARRRLPRRGARRGFRGRGPWPSASAPRYSWRRPSGSLSANPTFHGIVLA